jgi:hypothetical protein
MSRWFVLMIAAVAAVAGFTATPASAAGKSNPYAMAIAP